MVELEKFLKTQYDFQEGVELFKKHVNNPFLLKIIEKGDSTAARNYIESALRDVIRKSDAKIKEQNPSSQRRENDSRTIRASKHGNVLRNGQKVASSIDRLPVDSYHSNSAPVLLGNIGVVRKQAYNQRGHFHGMLHAAKTNEERYAYACEIMSLQKRIDTLNEDLRKMQQNKLPTKAALQYMTAEQYKHYTALIDSLRRYNKLKREAKTDAEREKYALLVMKKESELEKLRL
jgi:hypothetical protein